MLDIYYQITELADKHGLSKEVDAIDARMMRLSQVAPVGMTIQQYIQDIYLRIATLSTQIQQMQQSQSSSYQPRRNNPQSTMVNLDTMQDQTVQMRSNNPLNLEIEQ